MSSQIDTKGIKLTGIAFKPQEKAVVYLASAFGVMAPIAYTRYMAFPESDSVMQEAAYWTVSTVVIHPFSMVTGLLGYATGITSVLIQRTKNSGRSIRSGLEEKIEL